MTVSGLRALRERKALSIRALAAEAGVSPATVLRGEQGHAIYPVSVRKLAKALDVTPAELRGDAGAPAPAPAPLVAISERKAVLVANLLDQAGRARRRGDEDGAMQFERMAAEAAVADGVA